MTAATGADRQAKFRQSRRDEGWKLWRVWIMPETETECTVAIQAIQSAHTLQSLDPGTDPAE